MLKTIGILCYDDNDDDHHASHDTQGSADLQMLLRTTSSTMMGLESANRLRIHIRTCGSWVGKYYTSFFFFFSKWRPPYDDF